MKKVIFGFFFFFLVSMFAYSQDEYKPLEIIETLRVDKSKKEIYLATRLWFYMNFNSYEGVLSVDDFENGMMYAKGILPIFYFRKGKSFWKNSGVGGQVRFNLRIYFNDGYYKVIFDNLIHENKFVSSGTSSDSGFGLITNNPIHETEGRMLAKAINRNWNLLQEMIPIQINDLKSGLKDIIENKNEMSLD